MNKTVYLLMLFRAYCTKAYDVSNTKKTCMYHKFEGLRDYDILCYRDKEKQELDLQISSHNYIFEVHCNDSNSLDRFDTSILNNSKSLHLNNINTSVSFYYCRAPINLDETLNQFGINLTKIIKLFFYHDMIQLNKHLFKDLINLEELGLFGNGIESIDNSFEYVNNLTILNLFDNHLTSLNVNVFKNTPKLEQLELSNNNILDINSRAFEPLKKLETLNLDGNNLRHLHKDVFKECKKIQTVDLSHNPLQQIDENLFYYNTELLHIALSGTELSELPNNLFEKNRNLKTILLADNKKIEHLPLNLVTNLTNLQTISVKYCGLVDLEKDVFTGLNNLNTLLLSQNKLRKLDSGVFNGLKQLKELNLAENHLESLPENIFDDLKNLNVLTLENNNLQELRKLLFANLSELTELNLNGNGIEEIHRRVFLSCYAMKVLKLSKNKLKHYSNLFSSFKQQEYLQELYLDHNQIVQMELEDYAKNLRKLDLSNNNISSLDGLQITFHSHVDIDLSFNFISKINFRLLELKMRANDYNFQIKLDLSNNSLVCDCQLYDFVKYMKHQTSVIIDNNLYCAEPKKLEDVFLKTMNLDDLTCSIETCPESCYCSTRTHDKSVVVDCSYRNLTSVPELRLPNNITFKDTEVLLNGNELTASPNEHHGYDNVTILNLADNNIRNLSWIPPKIKVLLVNNNKLQSINNILHELNQTKTLLQSNFINNPWICDCSTLNFSKYIREYANIQVHPKKITCAKTGKSLMELTSSQLCKSTQVILILGITSLCILTLSCILFALYYRYNQEIKVWLFAHNIFLWFVTEEEIDKDKLYDAFISYAHQDENFVENELLTILESGPEPYKICLHVRNLIAGEFIATQIVDSVEQSRRTIVILSKHFLSSVWGTMEFRTAHQKALSEGLTRVIIIIYGDINLNDIVDDELKVYLKTNTYIQWGDPWFWHKLKYALPHSQKRFESKNKRFENMIKKIDKLDLMSEPTTPNTGSTPPVVITTL